jgi:hypothetical protein
MGKVLTLNISIPYSVVTVVFFKLDPGATTVILWPFWANISTMAVYMLKDSFISGNANIKKRTFITIYLKNVTY